MNLKPFLSWCASQGVATPLDVKVRPDGSRFVVLKQDADINRSAATVNLIECPLAACLVAASNEELADKLSYEKSLGDESKFAPHINTLPDQPPDLPRFWKPERFELLTDGGFLQQAVEEDQARYDAAKDPWALAMTDSRANILPGQTYSLTPLLGLINHDATVKTSAEINNDALYLNVDAEFLPQPKESRSLFGLFQQPESPEICISYGDLTNLQTVLNYGFVVSDNPVNTEFMQISMVRHPPVFSEIKSDGSVDTISLGVLRKYLATAEELASAGTAGPLTLFLSKRNEVEVYALIAGFLEEAIDDANKGAGATSDDIIRDYLLGRATTLQKGLDQIERKYPEVFG